MTSRVTAEIAKLAERFFLCGLCVLCGFDLSFVRAAARPGHRRRDGQRFVRVETYPNDAPKTVAHVVDLVKRGL